ncbi:hypothetical protein [Persephonella sp.]
MKASRLIFAGILLSSGAFAVEFQYSLKSFVWEEFGDSGNKLLKESGFLHEIGATHKFEIPVLYLKPYIGVEIGSVKYDGATWAGTPVESDTNYWGVRTKIAIGKELGIFYGETGTGYDYWKRNIETVDTAIGYTETWSQWYIPVRAGIKTDMEDVELWCFGEYRFNLETKNQPSIGGITIKPKSGLFFSVGGGVRVSGITAEVVYSYDKWKKSDPACSLSGCYLQPESKRQVLQFTLGYLF